MDVGQLERAGPIPAYAGEPKLPALFHRAVGAYPRVCGGTNAMAKRIETRKGLSPRMRGNQANAQGPGARIGPIPAYAGEPAVQVESGP